MSFDQFLFVGPTILLGFGAFIGWLFRGAYDAWRHPPTQAPLEDPKRSETAPYIPTEMDTILVAQDFVNALPTEADFGSGLCEVALLYHKRQILRHGTNSRENLASSLAELGQAFERV